jgi:excisionase family DNA binding protein
MTVVEAAAYTGLSERTLRKSVAQGLFPSVRVGRRLLLRRTSLDAALGALEAAAKSRPPCVNRMASS